jgi:glutathione synthase/RimK-type ligase-like ATP-grasp enzyme
VSARVGLLVGRERTFPEALIAEVSRRGASVTCEYAIFDAPRADVAPPYDVLVDRISHEIVCYQPWLKLAALYGTRIVNNPFWRIADDKFFNAGLASRLGIAVPKTVLLPQKSYGDDVTSGSLEKNMRYVDWNALIERLGLPIYVKPHWGGGFRDVTRVENTDELMRAYDKSGKTTLIAQEAIAWQMYVRCLVIGQRDVRVALWDPRLSHAERYTRAHETMPSLDAAMTERVTKDALSITQALGYDMNTVELAIQGDVPYAIDFMNSAPDFDVASLGQEHFGWVVEKMAELVIDLAKHAGPVPGRSEASRPRHRWDDFLRGAR